jgi:hypothetical protein
MARLSHRLIGGSTVLVAVAVAAAVPVASATTAGQGCADRNAVKAVFPTAKSIGFTRRLPVKSPGQGGLRFRGRCVRRWVQYQNIGPHGRVVSYVDVDVSLYGTPAQTLTPLHEPPRGRISAMADGGRANVGGGFVLSVIRNVFIATTSSYLPENKNGSPDYAGDPDISDAALLKIHRAIHAKVLQLR